MITNDFFINKYKAPQGINPEVEQALCAALISPIVICGEKHFCINIHENSSGFDFEYASSEKDVRPDDFFTNYPKDRTLAMVYYEISFQTNPRTPKIDRRVLLVEISAFTDEGDENIAVVSSLQNIFARRFFNALDDYPKIYIPARCYVGNEPIMF